MNRNNVIDYTRYQEMQFDAINSIATAILVLGIGPALFLLCYVHFPIVGGVLLIAFLFFSYLLFKGKAIAKPIDDYIFKKPRNLDALDKELKTYEEKVDYFHKWGYILLAVCIIGLPICAGIVYFVSHQIWLMNLLLAIAILGCSTLGSLLYINSKKLSVLREIKTKLLS